MAWIGSHSLRKASVRYMGIDVFVTHPDYKVSNNGYVNDIALVKLKKKIKFSKDVSPVTLPEPSDIFGTSSDCWIIGWGNVGTDGMSLWKVLYFNPATQIQQYALASSSAFNRSTAISWNPAAAEASHHPSERVQAEEPWADWRRAVCRRHDRREGPLRGQFSQGATGVAPSVKIIYFHI